MKTELDKFKVNYGLNDHNSLIVPYGSRVYGTASHNSDYDFTAIILNDHPVTGDEYRHNDLNVNIYNKLDFQQHLLEHKIHALEAWFMSDVCSRCFKFELHLPTLRSSISAKASHSFVKASKKIEVEKDYFVGQKSLFHSLRILIFGTQIAKFGKIINYSAANNFWQEIIESGQYNWSYYKDKYQPVYNELATEFKKLAPKEL